MKCPHCNDVTLVMTERQGVEIDYCPQCRGVWLDRGELDKLIARDAAPAPAAQQPQPVYQQPARRPDFEDSDYRHNTGYGRRKPKSWLSEIFD
ncbi:zf-TFIIB domain-containing protein [Polaromonas sp. YR568]|uniref:TFIIB-type zinc ribbon-containing protein n=1 Tax=Polaromonas sp. YR568 TaxID=1855301 RepID=UPI00398C0AB8